MYVTRPLSLYQRDPAALSSPPPEGPNSGYLVLMDQESTKTCFFGFCTHPLIRKLPFPQNKILAISYSENIGKYRNAYWDEVLFIPVLNQPLSKNQYYVIRREGKRQGEAAASATKEDTNQQFEIIPKGRGFTSNAVGTDGPPPTFLRRKGWSVSHKTSHDCHLDQASGLDLSLRARMPDFNFPVANQRSQSVVIGKWYCPFIFVKEGMAPKEQVEVSPFYEMTLEQRWDKIFAQDDVDFGITSTVLVKVDLEREEVVVGRKARGEVEREMADGILWFKNSDGGEEISVGLSLAIVERMKWEQERGGFRSGNEKRVRIERAEEYGGRGEMERFGCYVLVETFVLTRMDEHRTVLLTYDFKHTHRVRTKWE